MNKCIRYFVVGFSILNLAACMELDDRVGGYYPVSTYTYNEPTTYPQYNYRMDQYNYSNQQSQVVSVPDTYHVGEYHSPVSFKDRDREWVNGQKPQGYTIEMADGEKASQVAQKLYKAPKNDRMGQVQYERNGKSYYKGLYGSYDSPEAAQKALDELPAEVKQGAGVKTWSSVQGDLNH